MKLSLQTLLFTGSVTLATASSQPADHLVFNGGEGPGKGKHIVFIAGDEEYRSEQSMPMMAQMMAKQGFKCTVLFSMDEDNKFVDPNNQTSLSHPQALDSADSIVLALRFRRWEDAAMEKFHAAFERGVPLVALRTSTHAFRFAPDRKWAKYSNKAEASSGWEKGFGRQVLGETWAGHHGKHRRQGTRSVIEAENKDHPVLNGVGEIFVTTDVYGANPLPSTILMRGAVTASLKPDSEAVAAKNDPMQPVAWVREYKHESGITNRVFTTTMGAAVDLLDPDLRRLVANGLYWSMELEVPKEMDVTVPESYKPRNYRLNGFLKNHTPAQFIPVGSTSKVPTAESTPKGGVLGLKKGSRIAMVGGGLGSRMNHFGHFETELQLRYPQLDLYIRNMCKEGDTPVFRPHSSRKEHWVIPGGDALLKDEYKKNTASTGHFETPDQWLTRHEIDTLIGFFGYTESFEGVQNVERFKQQLNAFITHTKAQKYSGNAPQLAIVSAIAFEDLSADHDLPNGKSHNKNLAAYTAAMREVCSEQNVHFVDLFEQSQKWYDASAAYLTQNGHNLTDDGYARLAPYLADQLFGSTAAEGDRKAVHSAVMAKNKVWLNDFKIPNGVHVHGRRYKPFGPQNYPDELKKTREMTAIRDRAIWAANHGKSFDVAAADAKTHKLAPVKSNRGNKPLTPYIGGKETEAMLTMADGYKMELFASEEQFPELANPMQLSFDNKGRLWVACMPSYPHYRIGDPAPQDKLLILEDTDNDGKADKQTVFADDLHLPIGFEFAPEGVYVSQGNDLVLLQDTDGDDRYDVKTVILSGFDDHDTHHAISAFCADPSGAIIMGEGLFTHTNVETPYGVVRGSNGGFYRYSPQRGRLERTAQYKIPNPWGIAFDDWGQNFFLKTSGTHLCWMQRTAIKPRYGVNPEAPNLLGGENVRPTSGLEFISSGHFPDAVQGDVLLCNNIGFLGAKQHQVEDDGTGYKFTFRQDLFKSANPRFRPVDLEFAPDGSLYVVDWSNALIGHMQHNARDPKRDHDHGRIYRITCIGRPLLTPAKVHGATIEQLLENLKLHEYRTRYRTRRELRGRDHSKVLAATQQWVKNLDPKDPAYEHHLLEALYVTWGINQVDVKLIDQLMHAKSHKARAAAVRVAHFNPHRLPNLVDILKRAAADPHGRVRLEAITAATWLEKDQGLAVLAVAKKHKIDAWMKEAVIYGEAHLNDREAELKEIPVPTPKFLNRAGKEIVDLYKEGHAVYKEGESCSSCHGMKGEGLPAAGFPPLDGSKWVTEDKTRLIKIALNGLEGPLEVKGKTYSSIMPGFGPRMTDEELSAVLTYVRNAWSNRKRDIVSAEEVKAVRESLKGQPNMMKTKDLLRDHPHQN